jgi:transcriptional regulator with PAS, ATPase and Fis domain
MTSVRIALEVRTLKTEVMELKQQLLQGKVENPAAFAGIITASRQMRAVFQYLETVSVSLHPMLITGETGVGKELFAQAVHNLSSRRGQFIAVNVAGLEETAFSDTLFGHAKGAYTGADSRREGMIVKASGGTLFLDEIGDLKDQLQVKLLRLLQDNLYYPLGQDIQVRSEARIVVATNQDLTERMNSGLFRKDLFYRLRFHHVHIPPLRERKEDIPLLLDHFVREAASSLGKKTPPVPIEIYPLLNSYHFPGNVREFKAMVHDAVTRHVHGTLSLATFREHIRQGNTETGRDYSPAAEMNGAAFSIQGRLPTLKESEEYLIKEALDRANGNQGIAAAMLGLTRQALNKRLLREKKSDGSTNMP